jgi:hypothetical protein
LKLTILTLVPVSLIQSKNKRGTSQIHSGSDGLETWGYVVYRIIVVGHREGCLSDLETSPNYRPVSSSLDPSFTEPSIVDAKDERPSVDSNLWLRQIEGQVQASDTSQELGPNCAARNWARCSWLLRLGTALNSLAQPQLRAAYSSPRLEQEDLQ